MYRKQFIQIYSDNDFDFDEAKSEVDFILEVLFGYTYKKFMLGMVLSEEEIAQTKKIIEKRVSSRKPLQQIIGTAFFLGRRFFVNEYTLIPRPETEILVNEVLKIANSIDNAKILDIGTGSGCIPVSLAIENPNLKIDSVDISDEAIETAQKNALFHNVYDKIHFFNSNLFSKINDKYNIIVSNPPYIPLKDRDSLQSEVKDYEPASALFTNDKYGIDFYKKITEKASDYIIEKGYLCFEIGINQSKKVQDILFSCNFSNINIIKDLNGIDRIITAQK